LNAYVFFHLPDSKVYATHWMPMPVLPEKQI